MTHSLRPPAEYHRWRCRTTDPDQYDWLEKRAGLTLILPPLSQTVDAHFDTATLGQRDIRLIPRGCTLPSALLPDDLIVDEQR